MKYIFAVVFSLVVSFFAANLIYTRPAGAIILSMAVVVFIVTMGLTQKEAR